MCMFSQCLILISGGDFIFIFQMSFNILLSSCKWEILMFSWLMRMFRYFE